MTVSKLSAALILSVLASPSLAQQFNGAEGQVKFTTLSPAGGGDEITITSLTAGFDGTIAPNIGFGADFVLDAFDQDSGDLFNTTLHAMYMPTPESAYGVFYTQETDDFIDVASYGVQGGYATANGGFDAYLGLVNSDDIGGEDASIAGFGFTFDVGSSFSLGLKYDSVTIADGITLISGPNDLTIGDLSGMIAYQVVDGIEIFAEIGQVSLSATDGSTVFTSEDNSEYISIGASYQFESGTIFGPRGYNSLGF